VKVATFNVNGITSRLPRVLEWLEEARPDIACLQEIKCVDEAFPSFEFEAMGYNVAVHGQKGFNGVAILSKRPFDEISVRGLPGDDSDAHARYIEVCVPYAGGVVRVGNLYLPNGNPIGTDKFAYKLAWMKRFEARTRELLALEEPFLLLGDYNVIPEPKDCWNPRVWADDALFLPPTRQAYRRLVNLGFTLCATHGTAAYLSAHGLPDVRGLNKVLEGRPHCVDAMDNHEIDFVINTTEGAQEIHDSQSLRRAALMNGIAYYTTLRAAKAALEAIAVEKRNDMRVQSLQAYAEPPTRPSGTSLR